MTCSYSGLQVTYQVIQLDRGHALVDARDDFLSDSSGIDMVRIQAVTEPGNSGRDLVELDALLASIWSPLVTVAGGK